MVVSQCNKMSPASLAVCFGPVLMLHSEENGPPLDFQQPIAVLKYLLEIWPVKSGNVLVLHESSRKRLYSFAKLNDISMIYRYILIYLI